MSQGYREVGEQLKGSFLNFTQTFYKLRTGREFKISKPIGRPPRELITSEALTKVARCEIQRLRIHFPPRYGKTEFAIHFIAWTIAKWPDANYLYISYSHTLAKTQTQIVRDIISMPDYKKLFGVEILRDTSAKDNFKTTAGGSVYAAGSGGTITGRGAGLPDVDRFGGCIFIDDIHKPEEVFSDTIRESELRWYDNTLQSRLNDPKKTPIIFLGQLLHEDDLGNKLKNSKTHWDEVILPALDEAGNALDPTKHTKEMLLQIKEETPYFYAAQMQQDPQPAGGSLFKKDFFKCLDFEPKMISTFIVGDGAETDKTYNDATAFTHFGIYKIINKNVDTGLLGLHCIDCVELFIEPKDIESEFLQFHANACRHSKPPIICLLEKKSAGSTLISIVKEHPGINIINIDRPAYSGCKAARFYSIQRYVNRGQYSFPTYGKHTKMCIEHMAKITANDTHRRDDICDTFADAGTAALIDKLPILCNTGERESSTNLDAITRANDVLHQARIHQGWQ